MSLTHGGTDALGIPRWDFSSNANACDPCPMSLETINQAVPGRYPDPLYTELRDALAQYLKVAPWRVIIAASASEFIQRITAWKWRKGAKKSGYRATHIKITLVLPMRGACFKWIEWSLHN